MTRQSVSKWETGEATPEVSKLVGIAKLFEVSTDWLLSEDDFVSFNQSSQPRTNEIEKIPSTVDKLVDKYGWLIGIYIAIGGASMFFFGLVTNAMSSGFRSNQVEFQTEYGTVLVDDPFNPMPRNPFSGISSLFLGLGLLVIISGLGLAYYLKQKQKTNH